MLKPLAVVYLVGLLVATHRRSIIVSVAAFRRAWLCLAWIAFSEVLFTFIRAIVSGMRYGTEKAMMLTEVWSAGVAWLLLGIGMICLLDALVGEPSNAEEKAAEPATTGNAGKASAPSTESESRRS